MKSHVIFILVICFQLIGCGSSYHFKQADKAGTLSAYQAFLSKYPISDESGIAMSRIIALYWDEARNKHTIEAYEFFITKIPNNWKNYYLETRALENIDDLRYLEVEQAGTIQSYESYLEYYPEEGRHTEDAKQHVLDMSYQDALQTNTIESLNAFVEKFPDAPQQYVNEAQSRIKVKTEERDFRSAELLGTRAAYKQYLNKYNNKSNCLDCYKKALEEEDKLAYAHASSRHTLLAYETYINEHPRGSFVNQAIKRKNVLEWNELRESDSVDDHWDFINRLPYDDYLQIDAKINLARLLSKGYRSSETEMSREQELYNNLYMLSNYLVDNPNNIDAVRSISDYIDTAGLSPELVALVREFQELTNQYQLHEFNIVSLEKVGQYPPGQQVQEAIAGGLTTAALATEVDKVTGGNLKPKHYLMLTAGGALLNWFAGKKQSQRRRQQAAESIKHERYAQQELLLNFRNSGLNSPGNPNRVSDAFNYDEKFNYTHLITSSRYQSVPDNTTIESTESFYTQGYNKYRIALLNELYTGVRLGDFTSEAYEMSYFKALMNWPTVVSTSSPFFAKGTAQIGYKYIEMGRHDIAEHYILMSLDSYSGENATWNNLALTQLRLGRPQEALNTIEVAIRLSPTRGWLYYSKARILSAGFGDHSRAIDNLEEAIDLGFSNYERLKNDAELVTLREYQRFKDLVY